MGTWFELSLRPQTKWCQKSTQLSVFFGQDFVSCEFVSDLPLHRVTILQMTKLARTWHCINPCCLQWAWQSCISYSRNKTVAHDFTRRQHALWMPGQSEQCPWKISAQGCSLASLGYVLLEVYHQMDDETAGSPCSRPLGLPAVLMAPESHLREKAPWLHWLHVNYRSASTLCSEYLLQALLEHRQVCISWPVQPSSWYMTGLTQDRDVYKWFLAHRTASGPHSIAVNGNASPSQKSFFKLVGPLASITVPNTNTPCKAPEDESRLMEELTLLALCSTSGLTGCTLPLVWRSQLSEHGAELETAHTECCSCDLTYKTFLPFWQKLSSVCTEKNRQDPTQLIMFHHRLALLLPSYIPSKVWQKKKSQSNESCSVHEPQTS